MIVTPRELETCGNSSKVTSGLDRAHREDALSQLTIRPFTELDWPAVWAIVQEVSAQGDAFTYPVDISESLARAIWIETPPGSTVVATDSANRILGTAKMNRNQMGPGSHVATASFMVAA